MADTPTEKSEREAGIEAIIYLQSIAGITETREEAEHGWDSMQDWERESTMRVFNLFHS